MKFGTKLKLKKDWEVGIIDFEVGDIFYVAFYTQKYGMKLHHDGVIDLIDFDFSLDSRDKLIDEYFEIEKSDIELLEEYKKLTEWMSKKSSGSVRNFEKLVDMMDEQEKTIEIQKQTMFDNNTRAQEIVSELRLKIDEIKDTDRLAELEEKILKYYISKGYKLLKDQVQDDDEWSFRVEINSRHKYKTIRVWLILSDFCDIDYNDISTTTKEMFDKAFEFFKIESEQ